MATRAGRSRTRPRLSAPSPATRRAAVDVLPRLLPGTLVVFFGFSAGGYFPRTIGLVVAVVAAILAVRLVIVRQPVIGFSPAVGAIVALLSLFAGWTLLSGNWSDSVGRAIVEFDRTLLYVLVFVLCATFARTPDGLRWVLRGLLAGIFVVCACALITRALPELWPTEASIANDRLSYPVSYWNTLGALSAIGLLLAFTLTSDLREPAVSRVLSAGALPVIAPTLLFTFSRSSTLLVCFALLLVVLLGRSRGLLSGLLVAPAAVVALAAAYGADELSSEQPTTALAVDQGRSVAVVVVFCIGFALVARWTLLRLDGWLEQQQMPTVVGGPARRRRALVGGTSVALVVVALAAGGAGALERQYDRFVTGDQIATGGDLRTRLQSAGNNGRREQWNAALDGFRSDRLQGTGAGTYALLWDRHRESQYKVVDAHSLYLEVLAELGIVGLVLLAGALLLVLAVLAYRIARDRDRLLYAGVFAVVLLWVVHAGVDWDWEMPVLTAPVWALAGAALAASPALPFTWRPRLISRVALAVGCVIIAVTPVRMLLADRAAQDSKSAFARGDCDAAAEHAAAAIDRFDVVSEPWEILGYCQIRQGRPGEAVASMRAAVAKDPGSWRVHYGASLAAAVNGQDPRDAIGRARELNPIEPLAFDAAKAFWAQPVGPQQWRRRALEARLPND